MDNTITPDVTPHTRDTLLKELTQQVADALLSTENTIGLIRDMRASLAIDGPLLKPETLYTKEQVIDMVKQAYNLGATAHEESMTVDTGNSWKEGVEVEVDVEEGGFRYSGEVTVDSDTIREAVTFEDHNITDEQVEEILNA
jgi:hypothetical protein